MFAPSATAGSICGWTPTDDHHDTLYTTIPASSRPSTSDPSSPSSSTPRAARNPIPRSVSLDSNVPQGTTCDAESEWSLSFSPYHNATSLRRYKLKRSRDPKWAPRPPNAFILFRREYVAEHKGKELSSAGDTTLSKRAGEAWRALSTEEQRAWFDLSKEKAAAHLQLNPDYTFKPNKQNRSESRRHPALLSRREQVEAFIQKSSTRRRTASSNRYSATDECPTPGSAGSATSPEPPSTPSSQYTPQFDYGTQSYSGSIPPLHLGYPTPSPSGDDNAFPSGRVVEPMPPLIIDRPELALKRTYSYTDGAYYSPLDFFVYDDCYTESDDQSVRSFDTFASDSSSIAYFGGGMTPEQYTPPNECGIAMPEPQLMRSDDSAGSSQIPAVPSLMPPSPSHLMERRRRAATTSMIPSPLTVVTSSLSGWARDDLVTSRMIPHGESAPMPTSHYIPATEASRTVSLPQISATENVWAQSTMPPAPEPIDVLTIPIPDADLDRTPRSSIFTPETAENVLVPPLLERPTLGFSLSEPSLDSLSSMPIYGQFDLTADLESYNFGLRQYGISAPYSPQSLEEVIDFSALYCGDSEEQH